MKTNKYLLEICTPNIESVINARNAGVKRVELCSGLSEGGLTPSYAFIKQACALNIDINVLIRPRSGDFFYSNAEFEIIKEDIKIAKSLGANGIVVGILLSNGKVDKERMSEIVKLSNPMEITFHRAFDMSDDLFQALEDIIDLGCHRILTSGGESSAIKALSTLNELVAKANNRIIIMSGAGINAENISIIAKETNAFEFHASAKKLIESKMIFRNINATMGINTSENEYFHYVSDYSQIKSMLNELEKL